MIAQVSGTEAGIVVGVLALLTGALARQWQRDKANDVRAAKVLEEKDRYTKELAAQNQALVVNNTRALIELTDALRDRPCLMGDSRADLMKRKEIQP